MNAARDLGGHEGITNRHATELLPVQFTALKRHAGVEHLLGVAMIRQVNLEFRSRLAEPPPIVEVHVHERRDMKTFAVREVELIHAGNAVAIP